MITLSKNKPQTIERLGVNLHSYNYNIQEVEGGYEFTRYLFDHSPIINEVINAVITSIYPDGEELAIQRKGIIDPQNKEFVNYYQNVEQIKAIIKSELIKYYYGDESNSMVE